MTSKKFTFIFLLISLFILLAGIRLFKTSLTQEDVFQATDRYAFSTHAYQGASAFTYWEDRPTIPANCAKCHSTPGFLDFLGEDGSTPGIVDQDAPTGTVITCSVCHNPSSHQLTQVAIGSASQVEPSGTEGVCLNCHQALESTAGVNEALEGLAEDDVAKGLGFVNPHYKFAASVQYGTIAQSGYEYPDMQYVGFFLHANGARTCTDCHNPHSQAVEPKQCAICHVNVVDAGDFREIRMQKLDFDGDSNTSEGIYSEIADLNSQLLSAIQAYAREIAGEAVVYADESPFFYVDTNDNGSTDEEEVNITNVYNAWTPRLLRAAYNHQFVIEDAGAYAHNPYYVIQLLHDSLLDLSKGSRQTEIDLPRP